RHAHPGLAARVAVAAHPHHLGLALDGAPVVHGERELDAGPLGEVAPGHDAEALGSHVDGARVGVDDRPALPGDGDVEVGQDPRGVAPVLVEPVAHGRSVAENAPGRHAPNDIIRAWTRLPPAARASTSRGSPARSWPAASRTWLPRQRPPARSR